jgi:hypothetical protein
LQGSKMTIFVPQMSNARPSENMLIFSHLD